MKARLLRFVVGLALSNVAPAVFGAANGTALTLQGWRWWDIKNNLGQIKAAGSSSAV